MTAFVLKPHMQRWYRAALSGGPGSSAAQALKGETDGLALSFTDSFFLNSTSHYGSARVKDTSTPANNYNSHPFGLLTYSSPSVKMCLGPDGTLRYGAHNLLLNSENVGTISNSSTSNASWTDSTVTFTSDTNAFAYKKQDATVVAGFSYALTFDVTCSATKVVGLRMIDHNLVEFTGGTTEIALSMESGVTQSVTLTGIPAATGAINFGVDTRSDVVPGAEGLNGVSVTINKVHLRRTPSDSTYLRTTSAARYELPYEWDENGNLLGIRVEEQQTNLILNTIFAGGVSGTPGTKADNFNQVNVGGTSTFTNDSIVDGALRWGFSSAVGTRHSANQFVTVEAGKTYCYSARVQVVESANYNQMFLINVGSVTGVTLTYYLDGVLVSNPNSVVTVGDHEFLIKVATTDAGGTISLHFGVGCSGNISTDAEAIFDTLQFEEGDSVTSYIPTGGSTVTRAADVIGPALDKFPWNEGNGVLTVNDEEVEPSDDGTILLLEPPDGDTHIRTVKWIPEAA